MSKLLGLRAALELLTYSRQNSARHHLLGEQLQPGDKPYQERIAETCLLLVETEDHLHNLEGIAEVCQHVLASTVPVEHYLEPSGFDPWMAIFLYLNDEFRMPVDKLSPRLTAWLDARPQAERQATAKIQEALGDNYPLWVTGEDGRLRPPTPEENERAPETSMLRSMEQTFFTMTYATDLAEVVALTEKRGDIARIAALVV